MRARLLSELGSDAHEKIRAGTRALSWSHRTSWEKYCVAVSGPYTDLVSPDGKPFHYIFPEVSKS